MVPEEKIFKNYQNESMSYLSLRWNYCPNLNSFGEIMKKKFMTY
jgi:hypothetical protein